MSNLVVIGQTVWASIGVPEIGGRRWTHAPLAWACLTPRNTPLTTDVTTANLVVVVKRLVRNSRDPLEKFEPSRLAFQSQSRSLELTRIDRLSITFY